MQDLEITSPQNPKIKQLLKLRKRRDRDAAQLFLIEGYRECLRALENADLHLHLIDLSAPADDQTYQNFADLIPGKSILVCNKTDLPRMFHVEQWPEGIPRVETALGKDLGYEQLRNSLKTLLSESIDLSARPHAVISERHRQVLVQVKAELENVEQLIRSDFPEESLVLAIPELREALIKLGEVTGREYHEDLLDQIFSSFCIGK